MTVKRRRSHIFEKERDGHYVEPAWVSRRLFEVEKFGMTIHDPACGWGTILKEAGKVGYLVLGTDIVNRRRYRYPGNFYRYDFMKWNASWIERGGRTSIVSNPPFDLVREFCEHAVSLANKVAMICLVRRLNAARWLQELPLRRVWLLTPRPSMPPGAWIRAGNKPGGGTQDFCWLVFERGYVGKPEIGWLHREE